MVGTELSILLTVEDPARRDDYAAALGAHDVATAATTDEAVDRLSPEVDLVLVDREEPGRTGLDAARELAGTDRDPYVVLVRDESADFDVATVPVADVLDRPVGPGDLRGALERYRTRRDYEAAVEEFYGLTAKLASIEARRSEEGLAETERYRRLQWLVEEQRAEVDEALRASAADWTTAFASLVPSLPGPGRSRGV